MEIHQCVKMVTVPIINQNYYLNVLYRHIGTYIKIVFNIQHYIAELPVAVGSQWTKKIVE